VPFDLGSALEPSAREVGRASGGDLGDPCGQSVLGRPRGSARDHFHVGLEGHDAGDVVGVDAREESGGGLPGTVELLTAHGARVVEHRGEVEGDAVVGVGGVALDTQQGADHVAVLAGGGVMVDEELGVHVRLPPAAGEVGRRLVGRWVRRLFSLFGSSLGGVTVVVASRLWIVDARWTKAL